MPTTMDTSNSGRQAVLLQYYSDVNYDQIEGANALQTGCIAGSFGADRRQGSAANGESNFTGVRRRSFLAIGACLDLEIRETRV